MAKRRRRKARRKVSSVRRVYLKPKRRRKRSSGMKGILGEAVPIIAYGAGRGYLMQLASPLTARLGMLGTYAPNVALGGAAWAVGKFIPGSRRFTKPIMKAELLMASLKLGSQLSSGLGVGTGSGIATPGAIRV